MADLHLFSNSPSLNLTDHQHEPPIFSSTPLPIVEKPLPSSSTSSSLLFPTDTTPNHEQLLKLNEDLCLLGLFDFIPTSISIDQTFLTCRQLVKNYHKLSHEKHLLHEKLRHYEQEQIKQEKKSTSTKSDTDRLQITNEQISSNIERLHTKYDQLKQIVQIRDKEIHRLNQLFVQQTTLAKHQYRTLERQMNKFKERLLHCEKSGFTTSTIDYSWPLLLNESIPSPVASSSEVLLKKICHDYDQKHRLLMMENEQLRQCVIEIDRKLAHLLLLHRHPSELLIDRTDGDEESFATQLMHLPCNAVTEIVHRHFSTIYEQLDRHMLSDRQVSPSHEQNIERATSGVRDHFLGQ